jgi:hypothetical protein
MGDVINKKAAVEDIASDCRSTLNAAGARGAVFRPLAEQYLRAPLAVFELVERRLQSANETLAPLTAMLDAMDDAADALLGRLSDEIWNDVGRPASDPIYSLLFPEGVTFYTDGPDAEQPARMELLAELLEANLHPKLDGKRAKAIAKQIRESAKTLRAAVEATTMPRAQATMLGRARTAVARSLQMSLVSLKRHYRAAGHSEAEIHSIIPHRARSHGKTPPAPPSPPAPSPAPVG